MAEQVLLPNLVAAVEAIAAVRAVSFAKEIGLNSIVLEGDSEIIINSLKSEENDHAVSTGVCKVDIRC
uniref:RNase H type-1 domain-containing protein n=1 Tax=Quercus lobata TaxID=97700 RepID=A0A7N2MCV5_QUELO